jgi:hypothetical protein
VKSNRTPAVALLGLMAGAVQPGNPARAADAGATSCDAQVAAYRKWIGAGPRTMFGGGASPYVRLVEAGRGPEWQAESQTTEVRPKGVYYQGLGLRVAGWQERMSEEVQRGARPADRPLALEIDRDAKWSLVSDVVTAAGAAGVPKIVILLMRRFDLAAPPGTPLPKAAASEGDRHWQQVTTSNARYEMLERILRPCRPAVDALAEIAGMDPSQKGQVFVDGIPAALLRCKCSVRPADAEPMIFLTFAPDPDGGVRRPYVAATITTSAGRGANAVVVRAPKDLPWSEAYRRVVDAAASAGDRPLRLVVDEGK